MLLGQHFAVIFDAVPGDSGLRERDCDDAPPRAGVIAANLGKVIGKQYKRVRWLEVERIMVQSARANHISGRKLLDGGNG